MERSSVCLLPVLEDAMEGAREDCLDEALELALEEMGFLLPTELALPWEERASGGERRVEEVRTSDQKRSRGRFYNCQ